MKVAVVGSRRFAELWRVRDYIENDTTHVDEIVTGGARGVDQAAYDAARDLGRPLRVFLADWDKHGRAAGPIRNAEIVAYADRMVAFHDGLSPGTSDSIAKMTAAGKPVEVIVVSNYRGNDAVANARRVDMEWRKR